MQPRAVAKRREKGYNSKERGGPMHNEPSAAIRGQFSRYALPSMFSQLLNSCFIIVDGLFIGQNLGDAGLAAINVAWPMVAFIQAVSLAVGTGGAVRLATAQGKGDEAEALTARGNAVTLLAVCAAVLGVGLGLTYPYILPLIGANEATITVRWVWN